MYKDSQETYMYSFVANNSLGHTRVLSLSLQWHHNERDGVSDRRRLDCFLNRLFRRRSKKASKLRVSGLCEGNSPHKRPLTRKMFPFGDVIMVLRWNSVYPVVDVILQFVLCIVLKLTPFNGQRENPIYLLLNTLPTKYKNCIFRFT